MMSSVRPRERHCPRLHDNRRRDARLHGDRDAPLQTAMRVYLALKQLRVFGQFAGSLYMNSLNETYKPTQVRPHEPETPGLPAQEPGKMSSGFGD